MKRKIKQHVKSEVTKNISDQLDGGEELHQSVLLAGEVLRPVTGLSGKGAEFFKESILEKKRKKYKIVTHQEIRTREKSKVVSREKTKTGKSSQGAEKQGTNGKRNLRFRKVKAFLEKRKAKMQTHNSENQNPDLLGGKAKIYGTKTVLTLLGILGGALSLIALVAVPIVLIIALLYHSPLALFLPPLAGGDTLQTVTESYVTEFMEEIESLADDHVGYDEGEIYYRDPDGNVVLSRPQKDILCVYMVKYGVGDIATVINDKARGRLLGVVEDMCRYSTLDRTEKRKDEKGKTVRRQERCTTLYWVK